VTLQISPKSKPIDKKAVVFLALQEVFTLTPKEGQLLDTQVDFILENKLLKSSSLLRKAGKFFYALGIKLYKLV
jgi:hypothetical protein